MTAIAAVAVLATGIFRGLLVYDFGFFADTFEALTTTASGIAPTIEIGVKSVDAS